MKHLHLILALAAASGATGLAGAQDDWVMEAPLPVNMQTFASMDFLDHLHGYMVGLRDTPLETHDGGRTWAPANMPGEDFRCVFALDDQYAWLFGNAAVRTANAGQTWQYLGFLTANEATFLTPNFGWISDNYAAQVTQNSGATWTPAIVGNERIIYPDFASEQIGIGYQANYHGAIWRTIDGGTTWTEVLTTDITNVAFVNDQVAIAIGGGRIYRSTDAGLTWTDVGAGFGAFPQIIAFDDSSVILNAQNAYKRSTDAGLTWTSHPVPSGNLYRIFIKDGHEAYGATGNGNIVHTTDAFLTWERIYKDTHIGLSDIQALSDGSIVAAGTDYIIRSDDGASWDVVTSGNTQEVYDLEMFDAQRGLAISRSGFVLRTTDGGNQWTPSLPSYEQGYGWNYCKDLFILDENIAFVSGADGPGPIIKTIDGGETWQPLAYPTTTQVESIWFVDEMHGWIGRGYTTGWIYRTSDGGDTWEEVWPQSYGGIWDIQFHDLSLGWALRGGSYILRTTDGGDTWSEHELPGIGNYVKFEFVDQNVGYAAGPYGQIAKTTNGGVNWQVLSTGSGEHLQDLQVISADEVWAVGGNNTRLHTTDGGATWQNLPVDGPGLPDFGTWYTIDVNDNGQTRVAGYGGYIISSGGADIPGDLDGDGDVDQADLGQLLSCYGVSDCGDIDGDGDTDQADLGALLANYGAGA